jgi:hypothetical protein
MTDEAGRYWIEGMGLFLGTWQEIKEEYFLPQLSQLPHTPPSTRFRDFP